MRPELESSPGHGHPAATPAIVPCRLLLQPNRYIGYTDFYILPTITPRNEIMAICILDSLHLEPLSAGIYTSGEALEKCVCFVPSDRPPVSLRSNPDSLRLSYRRGALARGVFGGQVISQALTAATRELPKDSGLTLNSMHVRPPRACQTQLWRRLPAPPH